MPERPSPVSEAERDFVPDTAEQPEQPETALPSQETQPSLPKEGGPDGLPAVKKIADATNTGDQQQADAAKQAKQQKEIKGQLEWRERKLKELADFHRTHEQQIIALKRFDPLNDIIPAEYDELVAKKFITQEYADALKKLDERIAEIDNLPEPTEAHRELEIKYLELKNSINDRLYSLIFSRQREIDERRQAAQDGLQQRYLEHTKKLSDIIAHIAERPGVADALREQDEAENKQLEENIQKEFAREFLADIDPDLTLVEQRNSQAFTRLAEITGEEKIDEIFANFSELDEEKQALLINRLRDKLFGAILDETGAKQLSSPQEVVPWRMSRPTDGTTYWKALDFLTGESIKGNLPKWATAGATTEQIEKRLAAVESQGRALRRLFGREWFTDEKTGQKKLGSFWAAFEKRKADDASGKTAERQKFNKEIGALFAREGPRERVVAFRGNTGYALIERVQSKHGEYERIAETVGRVPQGLKVGLVSREFPGWLRRLTGLAFQ